MSLIKEFAIEPQVMATWPHFNSLWEDFGVAHGRLISKYPMLWKSKVDELAPKFSKAVQASAISAKIRRDAHKFLDTGRTYDGGSEWLQNALTHMATEPFHAVIATANPKGAQGVLVAGDFDKGEAPYKVMHEDFIPRNAQALADCARLLLANCSELQFVDPYFDAWEPRFRNTFKAMLQFCNPCFLKVVEVHREKPDTYIRDVQQANYRQRLADLVPRKLTLKVFFWSQKPDGMGLHPRFLLTDLGGMHFENGLDEGELGMKTLVKPLSHEIWLQCRSWYGQRGDAFALAPDCILNIPGEG